MLAIRNRSRRGLLAAALATALAAPAAALAADELVLLARVGPWPAVSGLVGYGGRLWFVNSVKFVNHNSADVHSYDPATGEHRYEAHLFSQDAGDPVVHRGLLYWPFEDPRWSTGRGEFMATDGRAWRWGYLPKGRAFHVHAMAAHEDALYAATSAWRAGLQRSRDGGATWEVLHDQPTPEGRVSRITSLASMGGTLYAGLTTWSAAGANLLRLEGQSLRPVAGWPRAHAVRALAAWRGRLYGVIVVDNEASLWRTDGAGAERLTALDGHFVRALAAGPRALWAVTADKGSGALWRSPDGLAWEPRRRFAEAEPAAVAVHGGRVYVGAIGPGATGSLWGPAPPAAAAAAAAATLSPRPPPATPARTTTRLAKLDRLLASPRAYGRHAPQILAALRPLALGGAPGAGRALSRRLAGPFPRRRLAMFGANLSVTAATVGRWYLMWALAMNGHGRVPPALIGAPWTAAPTPPEKYLEAPPGAAWAAARLGQDDRTTITALCARLGRAGDPRWLEGDIVGALTALSGRRFGYDAKAWRAWWARR